MFAPSSAIRKNRQKINGSKPTSWKKSFSLSLIYFELLHHLQLFANWTNTHTHKKSKRKEKIFSHASKFFFIFFSSHSLTHLLFVDIKNDKNGLIDWYYLDNPNPQSFLLSTQIFNQWWSSVSDPQTKSSLLSIIDIITLNFCQYLKLQHHLTFSCFKCFDQFSSIDLPNRSSQRVISLW